MKAPQIEDYDFQRDLEADLFDSEELDEDIIEDSVWLGLDFQYPEDDIDIEDVDVLVAKYF